MASLILMDARPSLGRLGEDVAALEYERAGYRVLERNFRCREGELDLVVASSSTIAFVEVKTRRSARFGDPCEAVTPIKQARIRRLAGIWLGSHHLGRREVRFDVVSVIVTPTRTEATVLTDAF